MPLNLTKPILIIWAINCLLGVLIAVRQAWVPYMDAGKDIYVSIKSDPFDGTIMPIRYIPDWTLSDATRKTKKFEDFLLSEFIPIPTYNPQTLAIEDLRSRSRLIERYTYITAYMGSYRGNYRESDGSHNAVDIRAPLNTPILSIANGVVVRVVQADTTGNKFIVIRHDQVPLPEGGEGILYSGYLHLAETLVTEGTKVRKGDMIARVGLTGITTTPHLHFQIDREAAPFFPYWPFTSADSRSAGLDFFGSINAGLGADFARQYSISPIEWIQKYLSGYQGGSLPINTIQTLPSAQTETLLPSPSPIIHKESASQSANPSNIAAGNCSQKRFSDIANGSTFGKQLYRISDKYCLFQSIDGKFDQKKTVTQKEALETLFRFYETKPTNGRSNFLDIGFSDSFQGYADIIERQGIIRGSYLQPEKILSRGDFIELLTRVGRVEKNPSSIKIYTDSNTLDPRFSALQDYAYMTRARGGKIYPDTLLTRQAMVQILANIRK